MRRVPSLFGSCFFSKIKKRKKKEEAMGVDRAKENLGHTCVTQLKPDRSNPTASPIARRGSLRTANRTNGLTKLEKTRSVERMATIKKAEAVATRKNVLQTNWTIGDIGLLVVGGLLLLQALAHLPKLLREVSTRDCSRCLSPRSASISPQKHVF